MLQTGNGLTVSTTSLCSKLSFAQAPLSVTVKRSVAVAGAPVRVTVGVKELGSEIVAEPETTVQLVEFNGFVPGCAVPAMTKLVFAPSVHFDWLGPANAAGPSTKGDEMTCGTMKSPSDALGDCDCLLLTKIVPIGAVAQGSKFPINALTSTAT